MLEGPLFMFRLDTRLWLQLALAVAITASGLFAYTATATATTTIASVPAGMSVSPSTDALNFGTVAVGAFSAPRTLVITNTAINAGVSIGKIDGDIAPSVFTPATVPNPCTA